MAYTSSTTTPVAECELLTDMLSDMKEITEKCRKMYTSYTDYLRKESENVSKRPTLLTKIVAFETEADSLCSTIKARRTYITKSTTKATPVKQDDVVIEEKESDPVIDSPPMDTTISVLPVIPVIPVIPAIQNASGDSTTVATTKPKTKKAKETTEVLPSEKKEPNRKKKVLETPEVLDIVQIPIEVASEEKKTVDVPLITNEVIQPGGLKIEIVAEEQAVANDKSQDKPPLHVARKKIPKQIKTLLWNEYIGAEFPQGRCYCCKKEKIDQRNYHCGHVIPESKGGDLTIKNLRPVCAACNSSMGTQSMNEFTKTFFGWEI